jgi:hypothetical protein
MNDNTTKHVCKVIYVDFIKRKVICTKEIITYTKENTTFLKLVLKAISNK